jgi:6,7-dimethyl-8-ribityllumazine synthase
MSQTNSTFSSMEEAIKKFSEGEFVVVMDDDNRENEGDIVLAAQFATPEKVAFALRHTSGILCAPMTKEMADRLQLPQMIEHNTDPNRTAFTVSVDHIKTSTGVSAHDRSLTFQSLASLNTDATQYRKPGHIFPLVARPGGVLERRGHTEATLDLCKLSGLHPVGFLVEIMNPDGTMSRLPECITFARENNFPLITVEQIAQYRKEHPLHEETKQASNSYREIKIEQSQIVIPPASSSGIITATNTMSQNVTNDSDLKKEIPISLPTPSNVHQLTIGFVRTAWNQQMVDSLADQTRDQLILRGILPKNILEARVPGSFELPWAAQRLIRDKKVDVVVCFGVLLKGETMHFEYISGSVAQGLMQLQLSSEVPILDAVLNCLTLEQADARCNSKSQLPLSLSATAIHMAALNKGHLPIGTSSA